jgi:hypothetical protein
VYRLDREYVLKQLYQVAIKEVIRSCYSERSAAE